MRRNCYCPECCDDEAKSCAILPVIAESKNPSWIQKRSNLIDTYWMNEYLSISNSAMHIHGFFSPKDIALIFQNLTFLLGQETNLSLSLSPSLPPSIPPSFPLYFLSFFPSTLFQQTVCAFYGAGIMCSIWIRQIRQFLPLSLIYSKKRKRYI